ncbi:unnamed protein product [Amoebophrya sp. A25]|nr:unnamed protein product [Amoebophrya sp. A25]|eukprot:GSA25T00010889001.1
MVASSEPAAKLLRAVRSGAADVVEQIPVEDVTAADLRAHFPLWTAVLNEDLAVATLLVRKFRCDVNQRDHEEVVPAAAVASSDEESRAFSSDDNYSSSRRSRESQVDDTGGRTVLHLTCDLGNLGICAMLLERGARAGVQDVFGLTPLHYAARAGAVECLRALLDHRRTTLALINQLSGPQTSSVRSRLVVSTRWSALGVAAARASGVHLDCARLLLSAQADPQRAVVYENHAAADASSSGGDDLSTKNRSESRSGPADSDKGTGTEDEGSSGMPAPALLDMTRVSNPRVYELLRAATATRRI